VTRREIIDEIRGGFVAFGIVVTVFLLIGFAYHPIAYQNYWGPFERASCVSAVDGERASASFERGANHYRLRSGSDSGAGVHARHGTDDWKCRRNRDVPSGRT
jgi:hypothetical protein